MVKLAIRLFDRSESSHVEMVVRQLHNRVKDGFLLTSVAEADAILISPNDPGFETLLNARKSAAEKCPVVYSDANTGRYGFFLSKPATTAGLLKLLEQLERFAADRTQSNPVPRKRAVTPNGYVTAVVEAAAGQGYFCIGNGQDSLYLNAQKRKAAVPVYLVSGKQLASRFAALIKSSPTVAVKPCPAVDYEEAASDSDFQPMDLDLLLWLLGANSHSRFDIATDQPFRLKNWPDFARLPYKRVYLKLAALLSGQAMTYTQLLNRPDVTDEDLRPFVCACAAIGLLEESEPVIAVSPARSTNKKTIEKIITRFFGRSRG
ncbi:hypothetical protein F6455_08315 [Proteobacteria bacterium 005FR1]|nr:hypothetical protein [Proteobacteria bacterium 005FR1]